MRLHMEVDIDRGHTVSFLVNIRRTDKMEDNFFRISQALLIIISKWRPGPRDYWP